MSRNQEFRNSALFHGTVHPFKEGDIVTPQGERDAAWATTDISHAELHADKTREDAWRKDKKENPTWNTPKGTQWFDWAEQNPLRVYQVEPVGEVEQQDSDKRENLGNVQSKQGFRVIKQVR